MQHKVGDLIRKSCGINRYSHSSQGGKHCAPMFLRPKSVDRAHMIFGINGLKHLSRVLGRNGAESCLKSRFV